LGEGEREKEEETVEVEGEKKKAKIHAHFQLIGSSGEPGDTVNPMTQLVSAASEIFIEDNWSLA